MIHSGKRRVHARAAVVITGMCLALSAVAEAEEVSHRDQLPQPPPGRRPPTEAFSACEGKSEGADCTVTLRDHTLEGLCVAPESETLFCLPNELPPPPPGGRPPAGAPRSGASLGQR